MNNNGKNEHRYDVTLGDSQIEMKHRERERVKQKMTTERDTHTERHRI